MVWSEAPNNVAFDASLGDKAAVEAAFAKAPRSAAIAIENNRLITNFMETRGVIAAYDAAAESFTLTISSQGVHSLRDTLANQVLKVDPAKVRVMTPDVGGGFGTKSFMYREYALAAEAARRLGRPVKWVADRMDHFTGDSQGRDNFSTGEVALSADGRFLAMRFDILANLGAYLSQFGPYIPYLGATMMTGVYGTPLIHVRVRGVYTHTVPVDAYRGAGRPEAAYLLERLVDRAARELGAKPEAIRRRNFIQPRQMPYKTPIGDRTYDTGDFRGHMDKGHGARRLERFQGAAQGVAQGAQAPGHRACHLHRMHGLGRGRGRAGAARGGRHRRPSSPARNRTGRAMPRPMRSSRPSTSTCRSISIRVVQGDTARVRTGNGTGGSRSIPIGGVSVGAASQDLARKLKELASDELEAAAADLEIADGAVRVVGTDRRIAFPELARLPSATEEARTGAASFVPPDATYPNGTHIAEVEIDPDTGVTALTRYTDLRRFRASREPAPARRPGAWRRRAGDRTGAARARRLRRRGPAAHGELHGLRSAARRGRAVPALRDPQRALDDEPARHQGRRRSGLDRIVPGGHERGRRRARPRPWRARHRHAGDAARDPQGARDAMTDEPLALVIRPFADADLPAVRALFVQVNRDLAPPAMREAFEAYIARSLSEEIDRIPAYYGEREGGFWVSTTRTARSWGRSGSSAPPMMGLRSCGACTCSRRPGAAASRGQCSPTRKRKPGAPVIGASC